MSTYKYPKDLDENIQPFFLFSSHNWGMRGKKSQDPKSIRTPVDSIVLPMATNGLNETISNNWEEAGTIGSDSYVAAFKRELLSKVADSFGSIGKYISAKKGFIINDYASLAFSGTNFRTFEFTFSLAAKNSSESVAIANIVKAFKRNCLPAYQDWKILYPRFWNIRVVFPNSNDIITIKNCVLTDVTINNFPDNTIGLLKDGTPVKRDISVSFKELDKLDRNDYS